MASPGAPCDDKLNGSCFARNDDEARERYDDYRSKDPFPEIKPALLNSADIYDYVAATGMIHPFHPKNLKPASYGIPLLGKCVWWDGKGKKQVKRIRPGEFLKLEQNSIGFVTLEPMLRLPDYIAARFNLRITHIYGGVLLGTGPLVDPGFWGRLSLPLHNLTTNDYTLRGGERLVWMEFTKLSDHEKWSGEPVGGRQRRGRYEEFPPEKTDFDVERYLYKAAQGRPIRSSIPDAIANAEQAASVAAKQATEAEEETKKWGKYASWGAAATVVALITLLVAIHSLIGDAVDYVSSAQGEVRASQEQRFSAEGTIEALEQEIEGLQRRIEQLELETAATDEVMESSSTRPQTR